MISLLAIIPIITLILGIINLALPSLVEGIMNTLNLPQTIYLLLIEIPRPFWDESVYGISPLTNSSYNFMIGTSMTYLYAGSRIVAFFLLVFLIIIAAFSFLLQNFKLINEGTAFRILTGTITSIILIYLFPLIYDAIAAIINYITFPSSNGIIPPNGIETILSYAASIKWSSENDISSILAAGIMNIFLFIYVLITYISIIIMGILRIFLIGIAYALIPILIVIRLIPYVDRIADLFIQVLIGGILASLIVAFFFTFGYNIITNASISGLMKTLISLGILLISSLIMTILIPHLGSLVISISSTITGATTGAIMSGIGIITGSTTAGLKALPILSTAIRTGELSFKDAILKEISASAIGAATALSDSIKYMIPSTRTISISKGRIMNTINKYKANEVEYADSLILYAATIPHELEGDSKAMEIFANNVKTNLLIRPPEVIGREYELMTRTRLTPKEREEVGKRIQARIHQIMEITKDNPEVQNILLSRIGRAYETWKKYTININENKKDEIKHGFQLKDNELNGISPITKTMALKNRKINADKIVEFIQKRKMNN
jgi:hypothetical protein